MSGARLRFTAWEWGRVAVGAVIVGEGFFRRSLMDGLLAVGIPSLGQVPGPPAFRPSGAPGS